MLVLIGATPEGKKELVGFQTGVRESMQSWRELLLDIKQRGLEMAPDLAVGDGALGLWNRRGLLFLTYVFCIVTILPLKEHGSTQDSGVGGNPNA